MSEVQQRPFRMILPKKGRLKDDVWPLLDTAGLGYKEAGKRLDYGALRQETRDLPAFETLTQRPRDALATLAAGAADLAIVGLDMFVEFQCAARNKNAPAGPFAVDILLPLDISACRLCVAAAPALAIDRPRDLQGLRIATSYPETLQSWLKSNGATAATVITREGGVEDCVRLGLADAIFDVVQTGDSLAANNLEIKMTVLESTAALAARGGAWNGFQRLAATKIIDLLAASSAPYAVAPAPRRVPAFS